MVIAEMSNEQRRQLIDAQQAFTAWREAAREFQHSYRGSMLWRKSGGREYLARKYGKTWESLGPRSEETEARKDAYMDQRRRLRQRVTRLNARIDQMAKINRGYGLNRIPVTAARVLRKLDETGLLGTQLFVVGTHSLYAYEARAGVLFEGGLMATTDIDLLWDARRRLSLAVAEEVRTEGLMGLLRRVDHSFNAKRGSYRAINDDGFYVDLIRPMEKDEARSVLERLGRDRDDLAAAAILGLQWLINAPKFEEVAIGEDGRPLLISCIDPRAFALHKFWVSRQDSREPSKRRRDAEQARAVAVVASEYMGLKFEAKALTALPLEMVQVSKDLVAASRRS